MTSGEPEATTLTRRQLREAALAVENAQREADLVAEFERLLAAQRAARVGDGVGVAFATLPLPAQAEPAGSVTAVSAPALAVAPDVEDTAAMLAILDAPDGAPPARPSVDDVPEAEHQPAMALVPPAGLGFDWPDPRPARTPSAKGRHWVPRLAVLSALGAATIVIPVTATSQAQTPNIPVPQATSSALDTLATASASSLAAAATPDEPSADSTLGADQLAQARAVVSASRSAGRGEVVCSATGTEGNGALAAIDAAAVVDVVMPLQDGTYRVTSQFGYRWGGTHEGVDYAAPSGTPIHAVAGGEVIYTGGGKEGRSGQLVIIEHDFDGQKVWSWYVHMYPSGVYVSEGDQVLAGDVIGAVGSYGNSTGPHLHLEIHVDDELSTVDPPSWLAEHDAMTMTTSGSLCS
ncbi:M23 family metallopeptidase [Beutenbergia cavernae]|uniref:M23 family metallopeptidase n=1 Tax=Beutenbergia cavernae TaxID=84757 RepID=UPI00019AD005|nr:M23 family metallopeptidase [Beutenbergia cavernae]